MNRSFLSALLLFSLGMLIGCAANGKNGEGATRVAIGPGQATVGLTLEQQFTATVTGTSNTAVTWSLAQSNAACSPGCGTISATGLYTAPTSLQSGKSFSVTVTVTSKANDAISDSATIQVVGITVVVSPDSSNFPVATGVQQQFIANALPDAASQAMTWSITCDAGPNLCGTIDADIGLYTAPNSVPSPPTAHVVATSTLPTSPASTATVNLTIVSSRLAGNATYAFRASGFDTSGNAVAVAGNFLTSADGTTIVQGSQDEWDSAAATHRVITGGSLAADANDHGTLTLTTAAGTRTYKLAFSQAGDAQLLEFDAIARTSGILLQSDKTKFNNAALKSGSAFVFGTSGVDPSQARAGYAGLFKSDGAGNLTSGQMDVNDAGTATPFSTLTGTYNLSSTADGSGTLSLQTAAGTRNFAIYVAAGGTKNSNNPLTLFLISTDDPNTTPSQVGTIVFQDPVVKGDNTDLNAPAISELTGTDNTGHTQVSLTLAGGDGAGKFSGSYDANNAGTIVSAKAFTNYTYSCSAARCVVNMLGDPAANPVVAPVPVVLYLTAANQGLLLDQSSSAVFTGTMIAQSGSLFSPSAMAGSFAASTRNPGSSAAKQFLANVLFTSPGNGVFDVGGSQDATTAGTQHAAQALTGTYTLDSPGTGTLNLTAPSSEKYVIYAVDNPQNASGTVQHFLLLNVDPANTSPSVIYAER